MVNTRACRACWVRGWRSRLGYCWSARSPVAGRASSWLCLSCARTVGASTATSGKKRCAARLCVQVRHVRPTERSPAHGQSLRPGAEVREGSSALERWARAVTCRKASSRSRLPSRHCGRWWHLHPFNYVPHNEDEPHSENLIGEVFGPHSKKPHSYLIVHCEVFEIVRCE